MTKAPHRGFTSRHVFIDTNVFYSESMNLGARLFNELARLCKETGFKVHVPDIVLSECERRIRGMAAEAEAAARKYNKAANRWNAMGTKSMAELAAPDTDWNVSMRMVDFEAELRDRFNLVKHPTSEIDLVALMDTYFSGLPPFDGNSKEFPDAMIVQIASTIADDLGAPVYLVTNDAKMAKAAVVAGNVIPLEGLANLLEIAAEAVDDQVIETIDNLVTDEMVFSEMRRSLAREAVKADFRYLYHDVEDVSVIGVQIASAEPVAAFSPIHMTDDKVSFVCPMTCNATLEVAFLRLVPHEPRRHDADTQLFWGQQDYGKFRLPGLRFWTFFEISRGRERMVLKCEILDPQIPLEGLSITGGH